MSDFNAYTERIPTTVREVKIELKSEIVPEVDDNGDLTGETVQLETIFATAIVDDQNGSVVKSHSGDHTLLLSSGILTATQLQTIRTWLQEVRTSIETIVLP